jgi:SOS-response transcriptional repressor LexA
VRELVAGLGIRSTNQVVEMLRALERKGLVRRAGRTARTISLTFAGRSAIS